MKANATPPSGRYSREPANAEAGIKPQQESPRATKHVRPATNGKCTVTGTDMMVA